MAKRTKWEMFVASAEYKKLRSVLPNELSDSGLLYAWLPTVEALEVHLAQKSEAKMAALYDEWLESPSTSEWNSYLGGLAIGSRTDNGFEVAQEESKRLLNQQEEEVEKRLRELQDPNRNPRPVDMLCDSYLTHPFKWLGLTGYSVAKDFTPQTPKQVYAIYRIRSVYTQSKMEETDDPTDKLSWQELVRRLELAHEIYKASVGSEKPD
ncbi:hypothetical protein KJZ63_00940 [Patescibacteria group bacterium]|nr:hypothetical protein [Patescibacteria group bacterium]